MGDLGRDLIVQNLFGEIRALRRRIERLEAAHPGPPGVGAGRVAHANEEGVTDLSGGIVRIIQSDENVSNPPTDAQITSALGSAEDAGEGGMGCIDDAGLGNLVRLCLSNGSEWFYSTAFTDAV